MMRLLPFDHAIRNLGRSPRRLALLVGGSALVSLLVLGAVAFSRGLETSLGSSGLATNALVLAAGSEESVERSEIAPSVADALATGVEGIAVLAGQPLVSPEIHAALPVSLTVDAVGSEGDAREAPPVLVRGFEPAGFAVHPQVRLASGRWPRPGADEVAAGPEALARVGGAAAGAREGATLLIAGQPFTVVGTLHAPGTAMHGEFWMRLDRLAQLTQRTTRSCVVVALGDAEFDDVDALVATRLDLESVAMTESDYYAQLAEFFAPIRALVLATAILVSCGAALGGLNAMYAAFASRVREVGTLQALGFGRTAIAVSLAIESLVACSAGALLASLIAVLLLDGAAVRFSMGSFALSVDATAIAAGLLSGIVLGVVGAIAPIIRCLSLPIPIALRA